MSFTPHSHSARRPPLVRALLALLIFLVPLLVAAGSQVAQASTSGQYVTVQPTRVASAVAVPAGSFVNVAVLGNANGDQVPATNVAAVDVTVTGTANAISYLTVSRPAPPGQRPAT